VWTAQHGLAEGVPLDSGVVARVPLKCFIYCVDDLVTNTAVFNLERRAIKSRAHDADALTVGLFCTCAIHRVALIRRPIVLAFPSFWSG
jgi:hypothetical protein